MTAQMALHDLCPSCVHLILHFSLLEYTIDAMTMSRECGLYSSQTASSLIHGFLRFSQVTLLWPSCELITKLIIVPGTQLTVLLFANLHLHDLNFLTTRTIASNHFQDLQKVKNKHAMLMVPIINL